MTYCGITAEALGRCLGRTAGMLEAELISSFHFVIEQNTAAEAKPRIGKHVVFQEKGMLFRNPLSVDPRRSINLHMLSDEHMS